MAKPKPKAAPPRAAPQPQGPSIWLFVSIFIAAVAGTVFMVLQPEQVSAGVAGANDSDVASFLASADVAEPEADNSDMIRLGYVTPWNGKV